ncbi:MAG TPA: hypothetical protein PKD52_11880 [Clostridiales bacterium]|nr:hypothetical protein [Clostridiales bacterium]
MMKNQKREKNQKKRLIKVGALYRQIKAESREQRSLFGIIYGAGLILALLSVVSALLFIAFGD